MQFSGNLLTGRLQGDLFNVMERWCFTAEEDVLPGGDQGQDQHLQHPHEELSRKGKILLLLHIEQSMCQINDFRLKLDQFAFFSQPDPALILVLNWQPLLEALHEAISLLSLTGSWLRDGEYLPHGKPGNKQGRSMWGLVPSQNHSWFCSLLGNGPHAPITGSPQVIALITKEQRLGCI